MGVIYNIRGCLHKNLTALAPWSQSPHDLLLLSALFHRSFLLHAPAGLTLCFKSYAKDFQCRGSGLVPSLLGDRGSPHTTGQLRPHAQAGGACKAAKSPHSLKKKERKKRIGFFLDHMNLKFILNFFHI